MIKDVHIKNSQAPSQGGMEFRAETVHARTACPNSGVLEARLRLGGRHRALLAIATFIVHYWGWQARKREDSFTNRLRSRL